MRTFFKNISLHAAGAKLLKLSSISNLLSPYRGLPRAVYFIFLSNMVNAMGALVFPFMTLILEKKIGLEVDQIGDYIAIAGLIRIAASLVGGLLSDYIGRKITLLFFQALGLISFTACIFLPQDMTMVYTLLLSSFFLGAAGPPHGAMIADITKGKQRQGAYSLSYFGFNIGFAFAQIIGGYLFKDHFTLIFLIDVLTGAAAFLLILLFVKDNHPHVIKEEKKKESAIQKVKKKFSFSLWFKNSTLSVLLKNRILLMFLGVSILYRFVYFQWTFLMPLHVGDKFKETYNTMWGSLGAFNAITVVAFTLLLTRLYRKKSNIQCIVYAGIMFSLGLGMLGFFDSKAAFFLAVFIFTLGEITEAVSFMPFIMKHTPSTHRGRIGSVLPMVRGLACFLGPKIMGRVQKASGFSTSWIIIGIIAIVAAVLMKQIDFFDRKKIK